MSARAWRGAPAPVKKAALCLVAAGARLFAAGCCAAKPPDDQGLRREDRRRSRGEGRRRSPRGDDPDPARTGRPSSCRSPTSRSIPTTTCRPRSRPIERPDDHRDADLDRRRSDKLRRVGTLEFTLKGQPLKLTAFVAGRAPNRRSPVRAVQRSDQRHRNVRGRPLPGSRSHRDRHLQDRLQPRVPSVLLLQPDATSVRIPPAENRLKIPVRAGERLKKSEAQGSNQEAGTRRLRTSDFRLRTSCRYAPSCSTSTASSPTASRCTSRAFHDVLAHEGRRRSTEADYYARYLGYDDVGAFEAIGRGPRSRLDARDIDAWSSPQSRAARRRSSATCRCCSPAPPTPSGARSRRCRSRSRPARSAHEIRRVLDREQLTACFTAIVAAEDTPLSKPAPDPVPARGRAARGASSAPICCPRLRRRRGLALGTRVGARGRACARVAVTQTYDRATLVAADLVIDSIEDLDLPRLGTPLPFVDAHSALNDDPNRWIQARSRLYFTVRFAFTTTARRPGY